MQAFNFFSATTPFSQSKVPYGVLRENERLLRHGQVEPQNILWEDALPEMCIRDRSTPARTSVIVPFMPSAPYPLVAPPTIPVIRNLRKTIATIEGGISARMPPAFISP